MTNGRLRWKQIPLHFGVHVLLGAAMFILVGTAALLLHRFVEWLAKYELPGWMVTSAESLEYGLYMVDVLLFVIYILRTAVHHGRLMIETDVDL